MKKHFLNYAAYLIMLAFLIPSSLSATNYYVATTGSDSNTGTSLSSPLLTVAKAVTKAITAGDTIFIRKGTYASTTTIKLSKSGTSAKHIVITAYKPDLTVASDRPILDFSGMSVSSSNYGINVSGVAYCDIYGLRIKGAGDNGMLLQGSSNNMKIEFCDFYYNRDAGMQIKDQSHDCLILNCDAYANADMGTGTTTNGGNADGFAPKLDLGDNIVFRGCRSWKNSDDGWDGYLKATESGVATGMWTILENCWAWNNGIYWADGSTTSDMNGNGIKMGGSANKDQDHNFRVINCLSAYNKSKGFDQNNNAGSMYLYNCTSYKNSGLDYGLNSSGVTYASGAVTSVINSVCTSGTGTSFKSGATLTTNNFTAATSNFSSLDTTGLSASRKLDGSLPDLAFAHLASSSTLIDAGTIESSVSYYGATGIPYSGTKPDLGCFETVSAPTLVLSSGTASQSVTANTAITSIAYTFGGTATGATVSGLPTNVTVSTSGSVVTISGIPATAGTYAYTITTTQSSGTAASLTGTITVVAAIAPTLVLTSGTTTQSTYVGTAITNIVYTYGGGATGVNVTGLPSGVTATINTTAKTVTISGTPTVTNTGSYSVVTTGGSGSAVTLTGTITVNAVTTLATPSGITASTTTTSVTLSWPAVTNASSYLIDWCTSGTASVSSKWDFTGTWAISAASADANLVLDATNTSRFNYIPATTVNQLVNASGTVLTDTKGLLFTQGGATKVRLGFGTGLLYLNGSGISVSIPCSVGQTVTIVGPAGNATATDRGYSVVGGTLVTASSSNVDASGVMNVAGAVGTWVYTATSTSVVVTTVTGGMNIQTITVGTSGTSSTCTEVASATNSYTATGLTAGATYTYQVKAVSSSAAYATSEYSSAATVTTATSSTPVNATISLTSAAGTNAQSAVTNNTITAIGYSYTGSSASISWTGTSGSATAPTGITVANSSGVISMTGTPVSAGTYGYTITVSGISGGTSATASGTITVTDAVALSTPSSITASASATSLTLNWAAVTNATNYTVNVCGSTASTSTVNMYFNTSGSNTLSTGDTEGTTASITNVSTCYTASTGYRTGSASDHSLTLVNTDNVSQLVIGAVSSSSTARTLNSYSINGGAAITTGITNNGGITSSGVVTCGDYTITGLSLKKGDKIAFTFSGNVQISYFTATVVTTTSACTETTVTSNSYTATGLTSGGTYTYQVKANSSSAAYTTSGYTTAQSITLGITTDLESLPSGKFSILQTKDELSVVGVNAGEIAIYTLTGDKIAKVSNQNSINISSLLRGLYIVAVKVTDGSVGSKKFIKK